MLFLLLVAVACETTTGNNIVANIASVSTLQCTVPIFPDCCYKEAVVSHEANNLVDFLAGEMPSLAHEGLLDCTCQTIEGVDAIPSRILLY